jgi:transcriptional regulator with XRE-family HTH domain
MELAERVRALRRERFLSQAELAQRAGVAKTTIIRIEGGELVPYASTVRKIAEALQVQPSALVAPDALDAARQLRKLVA